MNSVPGPMMLGKNLMALRESRGKTITDVCIALNIRRKSLECWEDGHGYIGLSSLVKLCDLYNYRDIYRMISEEIQFGFDPMVRLPDYKQYRHIDIFYLPTIITDY